MSDCEYIVGIDEAGRGPLAGPVAVGIVVVPADFDTELLNGITDSKRMTEKQRSRWFDKLTSFRDEETLDWNVTYSTHTTIDNNGISTAIQSAMNRGLRKFSYINGDNSAVFLDGTLYAPQTYPRQETIIKGDLTHPIISTASVLAKVTRDRTMTRYEKRLSGFRFGRHKGYPTAKHYQEIAQHGPSYIHRTTFLSRVLD